MPYQLRNRKQVQAGQQDQESSSEIVNELEPSKTQRNSKVVRRKRGLYSSPQEVFSNSTSATSRHKVRNTQKTLGARGSRSLLKYAIKKLDIVLQQQRSDQLLLESVLKLQKEDHKDLIFDLFNSDKSPFESRIESDYSDIRSRVRYSLETKFKDLEGTLRNIVSRLTEHLSERERLLIEVEEHIKRYTKTSYQSKAPR